MLDNEQTVKWLVVLGIAMAFVLYRVVGKRSDRKRHEWFESVAAAFGEKAEHVSEFLSRFTAEVDQRSCEIAYRYNSSRLGEGGGGIGWMLVAAIPLRGVSDIYNLSLQPSDNAENGVRVRNSGYSLREGWLNEDVRAALAQFYELAPRKAALEIEGGKLLCRAADRVEATPFKARVSRLVPVARAVERTL